MSNLPDFEGLAIFAKVVQTRSFVGAAEELRLSKATVSKAISRLEEKFGTRLFNRTARRLAVTEAGRQLYDRAAHILLEGEAAESEVIAQSVAPRGHVRLTAPLSFGVLRIAPILPEFLELYPEVTVDLHLSDAHVDLVGEGYDAAIRVTSALPDSSLIARTLRQYRAILSRRRAILLNMAVRPTRSASRSTAASPTSRHQGEVGISAMPRGKRQRCVRKGPFASITATPCCLHLPPASASESCLNLL